MNKRPQKRQVDRGRVNHESRATIAAAVETVIPELRCKPLIRPFVRCLGATDFEYRKQHKIARDRWEVLRRTLLSRPGCQVLVTSSAPFADPHELRQHHVYALQRLWSVRVYMMQTPDQASWLLHDQLHGVGRVYDLDAGAVVMLEPFQVQQIRGKALVLQADDLAKSRNLIEETILALGIDLMKKIRATNMLERRVTAYGGIPDWQREVARRRRLRHYVEVRAGKKVSMYMHFYEFSPRFSRNTNTRDAGDLGKDKHRE